MSSDEQEVVSLQDVLEEDQQLQVTANAVLGDSDDSQCTYSKVSRLLARAHVLLSCFSRGMCIARRCTHAAHVPARTGSQPESVWHAPCIATTTTSSLSCTQRGEYRSWLQVGALYYVVSDCRNFRCDCGNSRFPGFKCTLYPVSRNSIKMCANAV